jgi:hypothetical protein
VRVPQRHLYLAVAAAATSLGVVPSCAVKLVNLGGTATAPSEGYK